MIVAVGLSCAERVYRVEDYGACSDDDECREEATCEHTGPTEVCRPSCEDDADCPAVDGVAASCGLAEEAPGQCVLPCGECPDGMVCVGVSESPTSPLVCVWES
ncbi:MAG: hypothetical protein IAG13_21120 [Deltaproteobacteria bacterium]|nr:hypothetical protein [Nannocystaceae bacterium]